MTPVMPPRLHARGWHGVPRRYRRRRDGAEAKALQALAEPPFHLDRLGVLSSWGIEPDPSRTLLSDVALIPPEPATGIAGSWRATFEQDVASLAKRAQAPVLALGGGLDAAAVLAAWRASGVRLPEIITLETGLPEYDEVAEASAIGATLGARVEIVRVDPRSIVELLPRAIACLGTPLYNLHPIGRLALARVAKERGFGTLVTGDGADGAFAGTPDWDYVPLVAALTEAVGLTLESPFLEEPTLAATLGAGADPEKAQVRGYLAEEGLPEWLCTRPKRARLMPRIALERHQDPRLLEQLALELGLKPEFETNRGLVGWTTLALLYRQLQGAAE